MVYSKVPKFPTGEDPDFEGWYLDFQAHASRNKYLGMAINVLDPNLPDGELAVAYESLTKEQKKALKKHTNCLNDLYTAFANNNICFSLFAKSMRDKDATAEQNKVTIAKWPRGRVHRVFDELLIYTGRATTPTELSSNWTRPQLRWEHWSLQQICSTRSMD